jgi:hypothetical protein
VKKVRLIELAHARSGDKGNMCNIGSDRQEAEYYPVLVDQVTAAASKSTSRRLLRQGRAV